MTPPPAKQREPEALATYWGYWDWLNIVASLYDAGLWSGLYVWWDKKKILCDTHDTELGLYLVIIMWTTGRSQNSTPLWPYVNGHPQRKKTGIGMEMVLQRTFHPPARLLVRFILAHIFRLKEKERINVAAKYTTKPLWTLLQEKRKPAGTTQSKHRSLQERMTMKFCSNFTHLLKAGVPCAHNTHWSVAAEMELCLQERMERGVPGSSEALQGQFAACAVNSHRAAKAGAWVSLPDCSVISTHHISKIPGYFRALIPRSFQYGRTVSESHQALLFEDLALKF